MDVLTGEMRLIFNYFNNFEIVFLMFYDDIATLFRLNAFLNKYTQQNLLKLELF